MKSPSSWTFFLGVSLFFTQSVNSANIIFDLNGVLVDTDKFASFRSLGLINIASYIWYFKKNPFKISYAIKDKFFTILNDVAQLHHIDNTPRTISHDPNGQPFPYYMRQWLKGTIPNEQIRTTLIEAIKNHPEWFEHSSERKLVINLINMIFTPENFIATRKIYNEGISFIKACKRDGHNVYILSNWDAESFALFKNQNPNLFANIDGYIISGQIHKLKPNKKIYLALLEKYYLNPQQCYFIDDQQENITAAQHININSILCPTEKNSLTPDFSAVAQKIKLLYYTSRQTTPQPATQ